MSDPPTEVLFDLPPGRAAAAFLITAAITHFTVTPPWRFPSYSAYLERGTELTSLRFCSLVGAVPWIVIGLQLIGTGSDVPNFANTLVE